MNEEEKKETTQEQLFDLGNGRFVDINKLILVAQQEGNLDLYTSSWSLGSRRNAIKTSINETLQAIKDGYITGRNANKSYNFNKDILQQTGKHYDPNSHALDYLNWLVDSDKAPAEFFTLPKPKEEPKKEGPKKYTGSYEEDLVNLFPSMEVWNARDADDNTGLITGNTNRMALAREVAKKHLTTHKGYDFSESMYKNEQAFEEAMNAIINAPNMDALITAMARTGGFKNVNGIQNTYFGLPKQDPPKPKTLAEIDTESDDAAWREYVNTRFVMPSEHTILPEDFVHGSKYNLYDYYQGQTTNASEELLAALLQLYQNDRNNALLAASNLSEDAETRKLQLKAILGLYTELYDDNQSRFKLDKDGYVYLDDFVVKNPARDLAGYYISYNPFTHSIRYKWIKDNRDILDSLRTAFIKEREDNRYTERTHFKVGGVIKMLGGGYTKKDSTFMHSRAHSLPGPKTLTITTVDPLEEARKKLENIQNEVNTTVENDASALDYVTLMGLIDRAEERKKKLEGRQLKIDGWNYAAATTDLASLLLSISNNPYIDATATGAGLASSVERGIANVMDKSTPWWSDLGWFLADAGAESLTMLPGFGTAAKLGKALKAASVVLNALGQGAAWGTLAYLGTVERERLSLALNKIINGNFKDLNTNDIEILTMLVGSGSALGSKAITKGKQNRAIKAGEITEQTVQNNKRLGKGSFENAAVRQSRKIGRSLDLESTPTQKGDTKEKLKTLREWSWPWLGLTKLKAAAIRAFLDRLMDVDKMTQSTKLMDVFNKWTRYGGTPLELEELASQMLMHNKAVNEEEAILKIAEAINTYGSPRNVKYHLNSLFETPEVVLPVNTPEIIEAKPLDEVVVTAPSKSKSKKKSKKKELGGKLEHLKALRKGGILKFEPGGPMELAADYWKAKLNGVTAEELQYMQSRGIDPNNYGSVLEFRNSEEYVNFMNSPFNVKTNNLGKPTLASWRDTGEQKYFDGTSYNDLATKDFHAALDAMSVVDRTKGLEALKAAGSDVEAWNLAFNTHFGDINKNIVGYNPEVDHFDGVSTQFRLASINSYKPSAQKAVFDLRTNPTEVELADKIEIPGLLEKMALSVKENYEKSGNGKRPNIGGEDLYKKVSGLYDLAQLGIKNKAIADYAKDMSDLYLNNIYDALYHQDLLKNVTNWLYLRNDQEQEHADLIHMMQLMGGTDVLSNKQALLALFKQQQDDKTNLNIQEKRDIDLLIADNIDITNNNAKLRVEDSNDLLKNTLAANVTSGSILAEADKAMMTNYGDYMVKQGLSEGQNVKDWNAALYANEVDKASLDYLNAVNYANLHLADDPVAWQEYVNKAANALSNVQSELRNKMYGFKTKQTGPNYGTLSAKKGGKLDSDTKIQIENSRFLSKQIIQQLKNRDKGLDRLSKITYKTILKSLGLE